jgi:hypothetical protein
MNHVREKGESSGGGHGVLSQLLPGTTEIGSKHYRPDDIYPQRNNNSHREGGGEADSEARATSLSL